MHKEAPPPVTYMVPWELAAQRKKKKKAETIPPACPLLTSTAQTLETAESPCPRDSGY